MIFSVNDGLIVIPIQRYFPSPLLSIIALIQYYTASLVGYGSGIRVSASYSQLTSASYSHVNADLQSLGPTLKLLFKFMLIWVLSNVRTVVALW